MTSLVKTGLVVLEKIFKPSVDFHLVTLSFLGKGYYHSFNQFWISFLEGCVETRLDEIGQKFWRGWFLKIKWSIYNVSSLSRYHWPLKKGTTLQYKFKSLFTLGCFLPSEVGIGWVLVWKVKHNLGMSGSPKWLRWPNQEIWIPLSPRMLCTKLG